MSATLGGMRERPPLPAWGPGNTPSLDLGASYTGIHNAYIMHIHMHGLNVCAHPPIRMMKP